MMFGQATSPQRPKPSTSVAAVANFAIDLAPLRKSRDFSLLWAAGLISYFGSMITYVAVPFQIKELTGS